MKRPRQKAELLIAIVPVNVLKKSKARLASSLDASARSRLSKAMLTDVLCALKRVRRIHRITVVSADGSVGRIARLTGAHFLREGKRRGLNNALRIAIRDAVRRKASAALILPADIPLVTADEVRNFLRQSNGYPIALTPSRDRGGTNALLLRPPKIVAPSFGKDSFRRHMTIARGKGLSPGVVKIRGISLDVDEPADLAHLKRLSLRNETGRLLGSMN